MGLARPRGWLSGWAARTTSTSDAWRAQGDPCEGTWPFERWSAGDRVHERVAIVPPQGASPGSYDVSFVVRWGGEVLRPASGQRRVAVGQASVGTLPGAPANAGG